MEKTDKTLRLVDDVICGYVDQSVVTKGLDNGSITLLNGGSRTIAVGPGTPIKVNTNIGISNKSSSYVAEMEKLETLTTVSFRPDMIMDHTIYADCKDFWREIVRTFDGAVGTLPHYTTYDKKYGLDEVKLLERIHEMLESGVSFMTLHFTADIDIYEIARGIRAIPVTSRGGGLVVRDTLNKGRKENIFRSLLPEIIAAFKKHDAAISVGTTYRPPDIFSALDAAHVEETKRQIEIINGLKNSGVKVLMEGVGHIPIYKLDQYIAFVREANCPFMPLGPMITDSAIGFDHITNAIGGAIMADKGGAHIINTVTREEHTGGVPDKLSVIEGLKSARVAAHSVNVSKFVKVRLLDELTIKKRGEQISCVVAGGLFDSTVDNPRKGCDRCSFECPILLAPKSPLC
ncbi:MAG: phosphomethylpyrimidine synthase ThiC [Candidatus Thiodiazotropha sp. (ex Lucinoma borealis)]|nr:phosphomethylpyrimidine synthase ThiC [Candidatus Thiodiazotropha sp. (ex Lucinoma borealis)]